MFVFFQSDGNDPYQLQLNNVAPDDEGWYMCYVSYGSGKLAYSKAWLTVLTGMYEYVLSEVVKI